jgi:PAS domain S-box-containing protein
MTHDPAPLLDSLVEGFIALDADARVTYANPASEAVFGIAPAALLGRDLFDALPSLRGTPDEQACRAALAQREARQFESAHLRPGRRFEVQTSPLPGGGLGAHLRDITARRDQEARLRDEAHFSETLNRISQSMGRKTRAPDIVQAVTDAATELTGAQFGAFFYNETAPTGEQYMLYALSGVPREAFSNFPIPRNTAVFERTFRGDGVLRLDDVTQDARYGRSAPHHGMPAGHLPVRSYLAVPVVSSSGEVIGGLFFGHERPARFTQRHEQLVVGVAAQAAISIDNARLLQRLQESAERLGLAMSAARLGDWRWDSESDVVSLSERAAEMLGMTGRSPCTLAALSQLLHRDDRERVLQALSHSLHTGGRYDTEYRVCHPDGSEHWLAACGLVHAAEGGVVKRMYGLVQDITERRRLDDELRLRADELAQADRRKDEFLATLAHELRNPLAPLRTSLELLKRPSLPEETRERARAIMSRQVTQMVRLIDELLDISRIGRGKIELRRERFELRDVVDNALEIARPLIDGKQQVLHVELPPQPVWLLIDRTRLAQVLSNLLNNATRYSDAGKQIWLSAGVAADGGVTIQVRDEGMGIAPDKMPLLFQMFTQLHGASNSAHGGLGVGLTLARRLVELHGGTLEARSEGEGRGSEFTVRLPEAVLCDPAPAPAPAAAAPAAGATEGVRVLVADDSVLVQQSVVALLRAEGFDVRTASDGLEAVAEATAWRPHFVLLDLHMPRLGGMEAARRLRLAHPPGEMVLLMMSGVTLTDAWRHHAREAGFDACLDKTAEPSEWLAQMKSAAKAAP